MSEPSLRILVVNHRDWRSPRAGGLEELIAQSCRRWAQWGNEVTMVCATHEGAEKVDACDGVRIIHGPGEYTFNWWAPFKVRSFGPGRFDIILEYISKVPCFIPMLVKHTPVAVMVPHLFGKTAFNELPWPMAAYAYALEQPIARVYRKSRFWALSKSTAADMQGRGVSGDRITVIYPGFNEALLKPMPIERTLCPSLIYLTRLKRYKRVDLPITVVARLRDEFKGLKLFITGRGDHESELRRQVAELKLEDAVEFCGFVSEERKQELMQRSWLGIQTSTIEGWGLGVIEVGACGAPTVASDSPGLCESVHNGETGILVPHGDVEALVTAVRKLLADHAERERLGANAYKWARQLSWEEMSRRALEFLRGSIKHE
jgi:glycosyltransferase involved in cell wall biosynthesis